MSNFYFIPEVYHANTAQTNRCIAYLKHFSQTGIRATLVSFRPNSCRTCFPDFNGIQQLNYWKKFLLPGKFAYISYLFYYILFYFKLKKGDTIYCYSQADLWKIFLKKGVNVYVEYTENPDVIGLSGSFFKTSRKDFFKNCKKLNGLFVISTALRQYFVDNGVDSNKIHIINMFVDSSRFISLTKQKTEKYIAYCGTASNNKDGVDQLIKAFSIVRKKNKKIKLYIIGNAPTKQDGEGNLKLVNSLGLNDSVVFTGMISSDEIPQILCNAIALVLDRPDNMQAKFGFPTKLGEYLASKNPTVLTRVGDIPLFLKDFESSLLSAPNNPEEFASKILWILENPEKASEIGRNGAAVADKFFNCHIESKKLVGLMNL